MINQDVKEFDEDSVFYVFQGLVNQDAREFDEDCLLPWLHAYLTRRAELTGDKPCDVSDEEVKTLMDKTLNFIPVCT